METNFVISVMLSDDKHYVMSITYTNIETRLLRHEGRDEYES